MVKFIFFDIEKNLVKELKKVLNDHIPNAIFTLEDVRNIKADVFVSPANSFGIMDGGIDEIYMEMFSGIQETVQQEIKKRSFLKDKYGRNFLPVGSSLKVKTFDKNKKEKFLISSPTMDIPRDIRHIPECIYYAMVSILKICRSLNKNDIVAIPGLGTGVGKISPEVCANQILKAYIDFQNNEIKYPEEIEIIDENKSYICNNMNNILFIKNSKS